MRGEGKMNLTGTVIIRCPAMPVLATVRPWIRECQELVCPNNEIVLDDGTMISFVITFPKALVRWQSWGQWLVDSKGRIWKMDDMAMTFHVISDLHGQVAHKDKIAKRVLQLDNVEFPTGIRFDGHYENHLNWDVVKIFRYTWPALDTATRRRASAEISKMLKWCLTKSCGPDGSFKISDLDDTLGDAYYYGVSFLADAGYFDAKERFWTNVDFPGGAALRKKIEAKIKAIGLNNSGMKDAYDVLEDAK